MADKQDMVKLIDSRVKSWFWLYNSVIDRQGWDMYKKMVYAVLACHSDGGSRWVEISSATIAEHAGCSVRKVRSVIDDLAAEGVLEIKSGMTAKAYRVVQNEASDMSKGRWFWCDKFLFERKDLDIYEKLVYLVLVRHADGKNRRAMVSYANIAMGAGCSRRKAIDVVGSLVEKGLLLEPVVTEKGNVYFINNVLAETFSGAVCEDVEQQEEAEVVHGVQGAAPGALVHAVQGAAPGALVHAVQGAAPGAPVPSSQGAAPGALVHGVQGGAAPCAPVRGQVVHGVQGGAAPCAPIQEINTIYVQEQKQYGHDQKQVLECLLSYGVSASVAYYFADLGLDVVQDAIKRVEEKKGSGRLKKSAIHYLVWLLKKARRERFLGESEAKDCVEPVAEPLIDIRSGNLERVDFHFYLDRIREKLQ